VTPITNDYTVSICHDYVKIIVSAVITIPHTSSFDGRYDKIRGVTVDKQ
jgi:hypothetical protein